MKTCPCFTHMYTFSWNNRVAGCVDLHLLWMEVMLMKKNFDFKDLMSFGMFLLALLTFIHLMCQ